MRAPGRRGSKPESRADQIDLTAERTPIVDLISARVQCLHPDVAVDSFDSGEFVPSSGSAVPVVDERGSPLGLLLTGEIHRYRGRSRRPGSLFVRDMMRPVEFTLDERSSVSRALASLVARGAQNGIVVDGDGGVVGLLSVFDILRWLRPEPQGGSPKA